MWLSIFIQSLLEYVDPLLQIMLIIIISSSSIVVVIILTLSLSHMVSCIAVKNTSSLTTKQTSSRGWRMLKNLVYHETGTKN